MYVGPLPLVAFAVLASTVIMTSALGGLLYLRKVTRAPVVRGAIAGAGVVTLLMSPTLVELQTRVPRETVPARMVYIDPSPLTFWLPAIAAVLTIASSRFLFPMRTDAELTRRYRVCYFAVLLVCAVLNTVNWCSPGWCERFGFPVAYWWWSDSVVMIDGQHLGAGSDTIAIIINAGVAVGAAAALSVAYQRTALRVSNRGAEQ
jgi:hypothetical protein